MNIIFKKDDKMNNDKEENENVFEIGNEHIDKELPEITLCYYSSKDNDGYIYAYKLTQKGPKGLKTPKDLSLWEIVNHKGLIEFCNASLENEWDLKELKSKLRSFTENPHYDPTFQY